jgi:hypothetical protein
MLPGVRRAAGLGVIGLVTGCTLGLGGLAATDDDGNAPIAANEGGSLDDASGAGADASPPERPSTDPDAGSHPPTHDAASADAHGLVDGTAPPNACAGASGTCVTVPTGWTLVAFAPAQTSPCPTGFDTAPSQDLVEGPSAASACACGSCTMTAAPSCNAGAIAVTYDTDFSGTCGKVATPSPLSNSPAGACLTDIFQGSYASYDVQYTAPAATGGTCSAPGVQKSGGVTYAAQDRVCQPNDAQASNCTGDVCRPTLAGPYAACIAAPGALACPAGPLSAAHQAGTIGTLTCPDCPCTVTGTCSGTLTLYTDTACTKAPYAISTDVCVGVSSMSTFKAYEYKGAAPKSVTCEANAPSPGQGVTLTGEQTICCAP